MPYLSNKSCHISDKLDHISLIKYSIMSPTYSVVHEISQSEGVCHMLQQTINKLCDACVRDTIRCQLEHVQWQTSIYGVTHWCDVIV